MTAKIILNPYSNRWGAGKNAEAVDATLRQLHYDFELVQTDAPEHGIELARDAVLEGYAPIVAAGGDGTISEVVNGILSSDAADSVRLGILPLGSANDYAFQLGIPSDITESCQLLVAAEHTRTLDAGRINNRFFMNDITMAFGARVNIEAATISYLRGSLIYLGGVMKALKNYPLPTVTYEWDGGKLENKPTLVAYVGNGYRTGGVFFLAPDAQLDDGLFDIAIADAQSRIGIMRLLPKTFNGSHVDESSVYVARCRWLRVTTDDPLPVLADGEIIYRDAHELDISILPGALHVISGTTEGKRPRSS